MIYKSNNLKLNLNNIEGSFYEGNSLLFKGHSKIAIKFFISKCKDNQLKNKLLNRYKEYERHKPIKTNIEELKKQIKESFEENKTKNKRRKKI